MDLLQTLKFRQWIFLVLVSSLLSAMLPLSHVEATKPSLIHFGGFFSPVTTENTKDWKQAEHLAAFVMAINEVNNKTDGVFDDILPDTSVMFSAHGTSDMVAATDTFLYLMRSFSGEGLSAIISSITDENALVIGQLASKFHLPVALTNAYSGRFVNRNLYPHISTFSALQSQEGIAMQALTCLFARKVVVFSSTDIEDIYLANSFSTTTVCNLEILANFVIRDGDRRFADEIIAAKATGGRYFILLMAADQVAALLEQGYAAGMFGENTVIATSSRGALNITQFFSPDTNIATVMTGFFSFEYWPNFAANKTEAAIAFAKRWSEQPSQAGTVVNGVQHCSRATDGDGDALLYQYRENNVTQCVGIDFSTYDKSGLTIEPYTPITYDATIAMLKAFHIAIEHGIDINDVMAIEHILINNVSFEGASGYVELFDGYPQHQYSERGTRQSGSQYRVLNFNPMLYSMGAPECIVNVGSFSLDTKAYVSCGIPDFVTCFPPIFLGDHGEYMFYPPNDSPPIIRREYSVAYRSIFILLAAVLLVITVCCMMFLWINRQQKIIRSSQPFMSGSFLTGSMFASMRIFVNLQEINHHVCVSKIWLGHLAFAFVVGSLFIKAYRVHVIVNNKTKKRIKFTSKHSLQYLCGGLIAFCGYLILIHALSGTYSDDMVTTAANQATSWKVCRSTQPVYQFVLYGLECMFLLYSFRVCWDIRTVPDFANESKKISVAMSVIFIVSLVMLPIILFLGLHPFTNELITSLAFGLAGIFVNLELFLHKAVVIYRKNAKIGVSQKFALENIMEQQARNKRYEKEAGGGNSMIIGNAASIYAGDDAESDKDENEQLDKEREHDQEAERNRIKQQEKLFEGKSRTERFQICQEQVRRWQIALMHEQNWTSRYNSKSSSKSTGVLKTAPSPSIHKQDSTSERLYAPNSISGGFATLAALGNKDSNSVSVVVGKCHDDHMDTSSKMKPAMERNESTTYNYGKDEKNGKNSTSGVRFMTD